MLTDVPGFRVGHWTDRDAATGCTVVIPPPGTTGAVEVRGGGASTRELALLGSPANNRDVSALLLTGGSAFGLAAAEGVVRWCEEQGIGHDVTIGRVPIVPGAVIFDLGVGASARRPGPAEGHAACVAATDGEHERGSVGAGTGATVGKLRARAGWCKGGLGAASRVLHDGTTVAALAVVNSWGDVLDERGDVLAGAVGEDGRFVGAARAVIERPPEHPRLREGENTTLVCIATDARMERADLDQVVRLAQTGVARAVSPTSTPIDGDLLVCLASGVRDSRPFPVGVAAAEAAAEAIRDGVRRATSVGGVPTAAERGALR